MIHAPRPLTEDHWHIQELIAAQEKRAERRTYYRNLEKMREEREKDIAAEDQVKLQGFWCEKCNMDFIALTMKHVQQDWSNPNQRIAFYRTKHKICGMWCLRYITDKLEDPYWSHSKLIAIDRGKAQVDLLQPFETNYNLVYGKQ